MIQNKNIAIVGANSILGQAIYERLFNDYNVFQVYHFNTNNIKHNVNLIQIDEFIKTDLPFEVIYFIGSVISFEEDVLTLQRIYQTNVHLIKEISSKFVNSKIVHASSVSVYELTNKIIKEESGVLPKNSYAMSKLWAEHIVNNHHGGGVNVRISSLFGVGMKTNTFLPRIINDAIQNKEITVYGDGSRRQNYISAVEASEYFCNASSYSSKVPLLATAKHSFSNLEVAQMIAQIIPEVKIVLKGKDTSASFIYDNNFTNQQLKINREYSFIESIKAVVLWSQKQY